MSRTRRSTKVYSRQNDHRAAKQARYERWDALPPGAFTAEFIAHWGTFRGGMLMCPSQCGIWDDERPMSGARRHARKDQRRHVKRSERQRAKKQIELDIQDSMQ